MTPQSIHIKSLKPVNVVLYGKKDFAHVTKLKPCEQDII